MHYLLADVFISRLKERLIEEWRRLDKAVNQWRDRLRKCIRERGTF